MPTSDEVRKQSQARLGITPKPALAPTVPVEGMPSTIRSGHIQSDAPIKLDRHLVCSIGYSLECHLQEGILRRCRVGVLQVQDLFPRFCRYHRPKEVLRLAVVHRRPVQATLTPLDGVRKAGGGWRA